MGKAVIDFQKIERNSVYNIETGNKVSQNLPEDIVLNHMKLLSLNFPQDVFAGIEDGHLNILASEKKAQDIENFAVNLGGEILKFTYSNKTLQDTSANLQKKINVEHMESNIVRARIPCERVLEATLD